ncbi:MAG: FecR domain-containing protein [Petrimonas sp.]|nr:FecR domain-containing protein [Petrimonas sp.]
MTDKNYTALFEKYLRNQASEEEIEQLLFIIRSDKRVQRFFEDELSKADSTMDETTKKRIYEKIHTSVKPERTVFAATSMGWKRVLQWTAILLLPVLSALSVYYFTHKNEARNHPTIITAQNGEKAEAVLPDGTKVWINSGSTLTYDDSFNRENRPVHLDGEAYFEVAKDKKHPFIVKTQWMDVQALGTAFNVRSYKTDQQTSAILLEGKIKVSAGGKDKILDVNQRATFDKYTQKFTTDLVEAPNFVEWKNGSIYFNNQTFNDIAQTLSRIYNVDIQFASEELRPMRFTGTLGSSSIKNALDILTFTSPMYYTVKDTTIILYYKKIVKKI